MDKKLLDLFKEENYEELEKELKKIYPQISLIEWEADEDGDTKLHIVFVKMPYMLPFSGSSYAHFASLESTEYGQGLEQIMYEMRAIEKEDVFGNHSSIEFENYWEDLESRGYEVEDLCNIPGGEEYDNALWQIVRNIRMEEDLGTTYRVVNANGKDCIYTGYDEDEAIKVLNNYNDCCGDWYLEVGEI